jgi:DNA-binding transcriptional ArsR family regulator
MVKSADPLSATFAALADPTRRAILERLTGREAAVGEVAAPFAMSLPAVSKHLAVLERAGLLTRARAGRQRHCCLVADPLREAAAWIARYRRFWEARLDALARYLETTQRKERPSWRPSASRARSQRRRSASSARGRSRKRSGGG